MINMKSVKRKPVDALIQTDRYKLKAMEEYEDRTRKRWYIIHSRAQLKFFWDFIIILAAIYNAIFVPLQICFP